MCYLLVILRIAVHKHRKQFSSTLVFKSALIAAISLALIRPSLQAQSQTPSSGDDPKLLARAKDGDANAQRLMGDLYYAGRGVPQDNAQAAAWYQKSADQGDPEAEVRLSLMYFRGVGVPKDDSKGANWLRKAAEQGNADAEAQLSINYY